MGSKIISDVSQLREVVEGDLVGFVGRGTFDLLKSTELVLSVSDQGILTIRRAPEKFIEQLTYQLGRISLMPQYMLSAGENIPFDDSGDGRILFPYDDYARKLAEVIKCEM